MADGWWTFHGENWLRLLLVLVGVCATAQLSAWPVYGGIVFSIYCSVIPLCYCLCSNCITQHYIALYCLWISSLLLKGHTWKLCEWKSRFKVSSYMQRKLRTALDKVKIAQKRGSMKKVNFNFSFFESWKTFIWCILSEVSVQENQNIFVPSEMWLEVKQGELGEGYKVGKAIWVVDVEQPPWLGAVCSPRQAD